MLRLGTAIRLSTAEIARLRALTGSDPSQLHTSTSLNRFIDVHIAARDGDHPEARLLRLLLEDERTEAQADTD